MWHSCLTLHLANRTALVQTIFKLFVPRRSVSGGRQGYKGGNREKLWVISREPLKQPLLKVLVNNSELSNLACSAFTDILLKKHMNWYLHLWIAEMFSYD